jgi:hypothetical protein
MLASPTSFFAGSIALAIVALFALLAGANAQTVQGAAHRKIPASRHLTVAPLSPTDELQTSTSAAVGSEDRYFNDTLTSGNLNSMGQNGRYGQPSPLPSSTDLLFRF